MLRHAYVSNMDTQIVYRVCKLESLIYCLLPKPRYVSAEFHLAGQLTGRLTSRYFEPCVIFSKDQAVAMKTREM